MSAVGGFAQGLLQGMGAADDRRRKRAVDALLKREARKEDLRVAGQEKELAAQGVDTSQYDFSIEDKEPFLLRTFNFLGRKSGLWGGQDSDTYGVTDAADLEQPSDQARTQAIPTTTYGSSMDAQFMADGGSVEGEDDFTVPAGYAPFTSGVAPRAAIPTSGGDKGMFPNTRRVNEEQLIHEAGRRKEFDEATDPYEKGRALRGMASEAAIGAARAAPALADDLLGPVDEALGRFGRGVLGFMGFRGEGKSAATNRATTESAAPVEGAEGDVPADQKAAAQAIQTEKPAEATAKQAIDTAVQNIPGHPDNPDQKIDWAEVAEQDVSPDDIPHVGVADWNKYRKQMVEARILQGDSAAEANKMVDQIQHQGFLSNLQQANYLLMSGDAKAASLAAKAAYQYFPNGTDIRFGVMQGVEGKPVLVGSGTNEETGEPIGKTQVITPDYLNVMVENFTNPEAFRVWKKDQDAALRLEREYNEVTKPKAQQEVRTSAAQADYYRAKGAEADAKAAGGGSGGLKPSDQLGGAKFFADRLAEMSLDPETQRQADRTQSIMGQLYNAGGGRIDPSSVIAIVLAAADGDQASVDFLNRFGLSVEQAAE